MQKYRKQQKATNQAKRAEQKKKANYNKMGWAHEMLFLCLLSPSADVI
jgi:hypothetical protein